MVRLIDSTIDQNRTVKKAKGGIYVWFHT
jgi:hypothetical protein